MDRPQLFYDNDPQWVQATQDLDEDDLLLPPLQVDNHSSSTTTLWINYWSQRKVEMNHSLIIPSTKLSSNSLSLQSAKFFTPTQPDDVAALTQREIIEIAPPRSPPRGVRAVVVVGMCSGGRRGQLFTAPSEMTTQHPLPHFLNLPLPAIADHHHHHHPLVFKLNLSADQYDELLHLDAEIEEGEEGGLRLEFDPSGKGKLHLSPNRLLLLNPPRSGPSRTNKPEEIYSHTPISTPSSSRSPLTGILRIPTNTSVYDLQRVSTSDHSSVVTNTSHADPIQSNQPSPPNPPPVVKNARPTSELSQRERLAGQRLKEKRLEEDRKKKEKQMVVLPDGYSAAPPPKRTRQAKTKAPNKQQFPVAAKQQPNIAAINAAVPSSKNSPQPIAQPVPPRRALPGSQTGKHLAHVHNQHLSNPTTPPLKPIPSQSQPELQTRPHPQPLPIPAPPAVIFKPPNSSRGTKPPVLNQPPVFESKVAPPSEPASATKLSTSTGLSSLSDEGEVVDTTTQTLKPPTPPIASLQHNDSSQLSKSSPSPDIFKNGTQPYIGLPEPAGNPSPHNRTSSATSLSARTSSKRAAEAAPVKAVDYSSQIQQVENLADVSSSPSKKHRSEMLTPNPNPAPPPSRPKKSQKRNETDRRLAQTNPDPSHTIEPPPSRHPKPEEPPQKPAITVKKITVPVSTERTQPVSTSQVENGGSVPTARKRVLESDNVSVNTSTLNKRVRQEDGVGGGSSLPTIRKVVRTPVVNGDTSTTTTTNGQSKRVKKKKKLKQPIDYTSSEVEEGEEPGEIVRSSRARPAPPPPVAAAVTQESTEGSRKRPSSNQASPKIPSELEDHLPPGPRTNTNTITQTNNNMLENNDSAYHNSRLLFYKLSKHYEFVCQRLEEFKQNRRKVYSLNEVDLLLCEAVGLEIELDRLRNRIIRNFSSSASSDS